jgi:hypothetical protein
MTTFYDVDDLERRIGHLEGELKDAKRILQGYRIEHERKTDKRCRCQDCVDAEAWLKRNR